MYETTTSCHTSRIFEYYIRIVVRFKIVPSNKNRLNRIEYIIHKTITLTTELHGEYIQYLRIG